MDLKKYETTFYIDPIDPLSNENNWFSDIIAGLNINGKIVLDFGCGSGYWINILLKENASVTGIDVSNVAIEHCRSMFPDSQFCLYFGDTLPFDDFSFDFIIASWVFQEIPDHDEFKKLLSETYRILKINGLLVVVSNIYPSNRRLIESTEMGDMFDNEPSNPSQLRFFSGDSMKNIIERYGFKIFKHSIHEWSYCEIYTK